LAQAHSFQHNQLKDPGLAWFQPRQPALGFALAGDVHLNAAGSAAIEISRIKGQRPGALACLTQLLPLFVAQLQVLRAG
jgi:hypothetical protein